MTNALIKKNIKLSGDFDAYVANNPRELKSLSKGAYVVLTSSSDKKLSEANLSVARNSKSGKFIVAHKSDGRWHIKPFHRK